MSWALLRAPERVRRRNSSRDSAAPEVAVAIRGDLPEVHAASEIDLRGMRVGEVEDIVMHAVDAAIRADLKTLRIIHGKGTGALRERVSEMLRKESRVTNFRLGAWNEGGAGVTAGAVSIDPRLKHETIAEIERLVPYTVDEYFGPQNFNVIKTVEVLEKRLEHIMTPMTVSVLRSDENVPENRRPSCLSMVIVKDLLVNRVAPSC